MTNDFLVRIGGKCRSWVAQSNPWTNVYGLGRTLLATGTAGTLACNHSTNLFRPAVGVLQVPFCQGPARISFFCPFSHHLEIARWIAVAILVVVASGWRPRFTAPLHWWLTFSLATSAVMVDGGDQVSSVLTLLLLPVALTDGRKWHWQTATSQPGLGHELKALVALFALLAIRVQVAGIYFHAAVGKMRVEEWTDGTVLYYWFTDPQFGATGVIRRLIEPLLRHGPTLALMTWGAMLLELSLFMALVMPKKSWKYLLPLGIAFHASIAIIHGLVSFFFAMAAALVLYLRPVEQPLVLPNLVAWKQRIMRHRVAVAEATNLHPQPVPVGK